MDRQLSDEPLILYAPEVKKAVKEVEVANFLLG